MMCCATNAEGEECSQLYDYDLHSTSIKEDEVSNVTVSPGQSLLLRCRTKGYNELKPVWEKEGKPLDARTFSCGAEKELCIKSDKHYDSWMTYLSIKSLSVEQSGTYTCKSPNKTPKSVHVHVQAEGFLSAQLDESKIISAEEASNTCLQASVSHHPVLQHCSWEAPDKNMTKCVRETWVTKHRTIKLCGPLISGDYKLHLEAGGKSETKVISVCVVDKPNFKFGVNQSPNVFTIETASLVPANYSWMSHLLPNESCDAESSWTEIPNTFQTSSAVFCNKAIKSTLNRELVNGTCLRFCLTNSVGSWCHSLHLSYPPFPEANNRVSPTNNGLMLLKVASLAWQ